MLLLELLEPRHEPRANRLDVTVIEVALGREPGTVKLMADDRYDASDLGVRSRYAAGAVAATSPIVPFDVWAGEARLERLEVVKIDVEGVEGAVTEGMRNSLAQLRPRYLIVELKGAHADSGSSRLAAVRR